MQGFYRESGPYVNSLLLIAIYLFVGGHEPNRGAGFFWQRSICYDKFTIAEFPGVMISSYAFN